MRTSSYGPKGISILSIIRTADEVKQDSEPLAFGKYKGKSANQVAEIDAQYIVWIYDTIKNRRTCSLPLARACGYADYSQKVPQSHVEDEHEDEDLDDLAF